MGILAEEKGLVLQIQIDRKRLPEFVTGDELRLRQILTNLVNNAVKFTEHGSITIKVVLEKEDLENKHLVLHFDIIDTAIGIPTDKQESIFETFNQADNSIARQFGGTGLGLSISKKLVETMNGKIWVKSELKKDTNFHFTVSLTHREQFIKEQAQCLLTERVLML